VTAVAPELNADQQLQVLLVERIGRWAGQLAHVYQWTVQSGPFAGTVLPRQFSWGGGYLGPKLLGSYEMELHKAIEKGIRRDPAVMINVGCAEGYYAVGLARRLPKARHFAYDISELAQSSCNQAAIDNSVADRLSVHGECTAEELVTRTADVRRALIVLDCEGAEIDLITDANVAALKHCDIIIECHDFVDRSITATLTERLSRTHKVERIEEQGRDPYQYRILDPLGSFDRYLVVDEFRPERMHWLVCWAR
jgi:hypothetical protein